MTRSVVAAVALSLSVLAGATSAGAATQIGETTGAAPCGAQTVFQTNSPIGPYAAPIDGVITSWQYRAPMASQIGRALEFKVARAAGGNSLTIVGESERETPTIPLTTLTFPTRIAVQAGDVIGLYVPGTSAPCTVGPSPGYQAHFIADNVDRQPGDTSTYGVANQSQVDVGAVLEPDCDADGFGDETQDPSLFGGTCTARGRALTLDANKNKVKRGKKVLLSGNLSETTRAGECATGQTVELQRKRPKQSAFTTFAQLQTDSLGAFSLSKKPKKTFEFRAEVVQSAGCAPALSNSERVKVKKKRR
jgi:hypothetical protein